MKTFNKVDAPNVLDLISSPELRNLDNALEEALSGRTLMASNVEEVNHVTRSLIAEPLNLLDAVVSLRNLGAPDFTLAAGAYDEKEFWLRMFLKQSDGYSLRLHIWLPSPDGRKAMETAHDHRRFLISCLLNNRYTSHEFEKTADDAIAEVRQKTVVGGTCYIIRPETIHAISNDTREHTVSLIVRGNAVQESIHFYDDRTRGLVAHVAQRPIGTLGRSEAETGMDRATYLRNVLHRIAGELHRSDAARQVVSKA